MYSCTGYALHISRSIIHFIIYINDVPLIFIMHNLWICIWKTCLIWFYSYIVSLSVACSFFVLPVNSFWEKLSEAKKFIFNYSYTGNKQKVNYIYNFFSYNNTRRWDLINKKINFQIYEVAFLGITELDHDSENSVR